MSGGMPKFDGQATLTVSEGYDLKNQRHYASRRCGCDYFHTRWSFRVWKVLLFLLGVAVIIAIMGLLIAMFGPGNTNLRYSKKETIVARTVEGNGGDERTTTRVTPTTKEPSAATGDKDTTVAPTNKESTSAAPTYKESTSAAPTYKESTSAAPTNQQSTSASKSTTAQHTTVKPTTTRPTTSAPGDKTSIQCDVAIVGGGSAGLLMAYFLLKKKAETDVCIFEKENRLGGKIFDHRFPEAPNVTVGLGVWNIYRDHYSESDFMNAFVSNPADNWVRTLSRVEARGIYADTFDSLKKNAFPSLSNHTLISNETLVNILTLAISKNSSDFTTAGTFLSEYLSPEGAKLMEDAYGFNGGYMDEINPESYKTYLRGLKKIREGWTENSRPDRGMSDVIDNLKLKVQNMTGKIYYQETVTSISKEGDKFVLLTTNLTVQANKTVLTVGPAALKEMTGDIIQNISSHEIFTSIVSVPAFFGAAVYPRPWWNDNLKKLHMFISSSDCLGITMPYEGTGPNGAAVLHTVANNGGCSDKWGNILKASKDNDAIDKEIKRALEYKFRRRIPVEPLKTVYKYWEEGFWYLQKPGAKFSLTQIKNWAKNPLVGNDVHLVNKAFYNFGGWLEDTISSTGEALKSGWGIDLRFFS